MTQTKPMTLVDTTPAGVYELADAKRLLKVLNFVVNETVEDDADNQQMMFALLDAIGEKIDAAEKKIEAVAAPQSLTQNDMHDFNILRVGGRGAGHWR